MLPTDHLSALLRHAPRAEAPSWSDAETAIARVTIATPSPVAPDDDEPCTLPFERSPRCLADLGHEAADLDGWARDPSTVEETAVLPLVRPQALAIRVAPPPPAISMRVPIAPRATAPGPVPPPFPAVGLAGRGAPLPGLQLPTPRAAVAVAPAPTSWTRIVALGMTLIAVVAAVAGTPWAHRVIALVTR